MGQKKLPLKPPPAGITLPEIPEGWEWGSTDSHDLALYMPGGFGTQFVLWANFSAKNDRWGEARHVSIAEADTESCADRINFQPEDDVSAVNDTLHVMTTRVLLGMFDEGEL